jgi:hypothetical protein
MADLSGDPGALLDVADFIAAVTDDVRDFFMLDWAIPPSSELSPGQPG